MLESTRRRRFLDLSTNCVERAGVECGNSFLELPLVVVNAGCVKPMLHVSQPQIDVVFVEVGLLYGHDVSTKIFDCRRSGRFSIGGWHFASDEFTGKKCKVCGVENGGVFPSRKNVSVVGGAKMKNRFAVDFGIVLKRTDFCEIRFRFFVDSLVLL